MATVGRVVLVIGLVIGSWAPGAVGQDVPRERVVRPEELVSLSGTLTFEEALGILSDYSKRFDRKIIIDRTGQTGPIGVEIRSLTWRRALYQIVQRHGLEFVEYGDYIEIVAPAEEVRVEEEVRREWHLDTREVNISAVFFEGDRRALRDLGVNWAALRQGKTVMSAAQVTIAEEEEDIFMAAISRQLSSTLDVAALLKTFESKNKGEIIANPQITVISGQPGKIQVGQDFSIKTRDFAGNVMDAFFSTGVILDVTPTIITQGDTSFVHLRISVQRSTALPGAVSTVINKTQASTSALLKDGESTVIAGLYMDDETIVRRGIPFLRTLPWWVFGIRYLTGYTQKVVSKEELVILIQARIVPSVRQRIAAQQKTMREMLRQERQKFQMIQEDLRKTQEP
jgi:type IV pilus assembly protein PilQ